jgi:signal transduction histidine kinase
LHGALERQTRFTGDAAHQLRTPLTILQGHIDVALRRPRAAAEYQETLALLGDETRSLSQLVESLLVLARSQEDAPLADVEPIVFDDWLPTYAQRWQSHARWPDVKIESKAPRPMMTSPSLLAQLLDNLVSNAFKYSAPGTPVVIGATADDEGVVITVRDRGTGIVPAEQAMIFDPFFRSPAARQAGIPGTGLGLSLVKRLSETLGLTLHCQSEPGVGSTFSLRFPPGRV